MDACTKEWFNSFALLDKGMDRQAASLLMLRTRILTIVCKRSLPDVIVPEAHQTHHCCICTCAQWQCKLWKKLYTQSTRNEIISHNWQLYGTIYKTTIGSMNHVSRYSHYVIRTLYCACVVDNTRLLRHTYVYCACVVHNRRTACAACILGGIVCMVFRSCSWSNA